MRLVLDTNVWIDWLLFDDPAVTPIKAAQREGRIRIVVDGACLDELIAVLAYPEFGLDETQKNRHLAEVGRCTIMQTQRQAVPAVALPRCTDPDDQKFLALAQNAAAHWLLTRDKALLRMNRRLKSAGIRIGSPADWSVICAQPA
jgi:putative PIN family toxin of toxin-antitoxin system